MKKIYIQQQKQPSKRSLISTSGLKCCPVKTELVAQIGELSF